MKYLHKARTSWRPLPEGEFIALGLRADSTLGETTSAAIALRDTPAGKDSPLKSAKEREAFLKSHPPLPLLQLENCAIDGYLVGTDALNTLKVEMVQWVEERGDQVWRFTDIEREDFTKDFAGVPLLDE